MTNDSAETVRVAPVAIGVVCGSLVFLASPFGPRVSPDSGHYLFMTAQTLHAGPFSVEHSWWPPGFPWLLSLVSALFSADFLTASRILNSASIGITGAIVAHEIGSRFSAAGSAGSRPSLLAWLAMCLLSLDLVNASYLSDIAVYVWSEGPFLALVTLGLFFIDRPATFGWGVLCFAAAWSVRLAGIVAAPLIVLVAFRLVRRERHALTARGGSPPAFDRGSPDFHHGLLMPLLRANLVPLLMATTLVAVVLMFNRVNFGFWMRTSSPGPSPSVSAVVADYCGTLSGFLLNRAAALGPIATGALLVGALAAGLYLNRASFRRRPWPPSLGSLVVAASVDVWLLWAVLYSSVLMYLMSHSDIFGTNRFVTPVFSAILITGGGWLARVKSPLVRVAVLIVLGGLVSESSWTIARTTARSLRTIKTSHKLVYEPHVRGTTEFREADALASRASALLFLQRDANSYGIAVMAAALFACKPFYYRPVEQAGLALPAPGAVLVLSETRNAALPGLLARTTVLHQSSRLGLEMALVTPNGIDLSLERPLSPGCP